jgi:hypothetical protein
MRTIHCSVCGQPLKPMENVCEEITRRGGVVVGGSFSDAEQWLGTVCPRCRAVFCSQCRDTGPGPCTRCGEEVKPAIGTYLPPSTGAVVRSGDQFNNERDILPSKVFRILIGYSGTAAPDRSTTWAIIKAVWSGGVDATATISVHPIDSKYWVNSEDLAVAWAALLLELKYRQEPAPRDHRVKALRGRIAETGMMFYVEVHYQ